MDLADIFKAYDVRGVYPDQIDAEAAHRIGQGFAAFAGAERVAVGHDCRQSSPDLVAALVDGITSQGADVARLGPITTDALYYASGAWSLPGVMVTASHNPPEYNGLKFCLAGAAPVGEDSGLGDIRRLAESGLPAAAERGSVDDVPVIDAYVEHLLGIVDAASIGPLRVAVDGGNGMAGVAIPQVFAGIRAELDPLYLEPDGTFPNHPADPLRPENIADLLDLVGRTSPDLAVAFDGDADRAFFVDEQGTALPGSTTTAIVADWYLERHPGATIVHNLICSKAVPETVLAAGGTPVRTRVGHSFIKEVMKDSGAVFGGEHSGHYYFKDHYRADSGILAMLILMRVMSDDGRPLSQLRERYEPYAQSGEINLVVADAQGAMDQVAAGFPDLTPDRLDGLTLDVGDGSWFNLRPSNTEPLLRLNAEAATTARVDDIVSKVTDLVGGNGG
ncbi:MAG: phosphomannomutase/phosphoglucomutase [Actinomycetota bacterium]|nr:phosphomannomutase/phosphoglucomutase [Actinomycetota bacterium]